MSRKIFKQEQQLHRLKMSKNIFTEELQIPDEMIGKLLGKGRRNIKQYRQLEHITFVKLLPKGKLVISGTCQKAIRRLCLSVKKRLSHTNSHPELSILCFCQSIQDPSLEVHSLLFCQHEKPGCISFKEFRNKAQSQEEEDDYDLLASQLTKKVFVTETVFVPLWDFSAYKNKLLPFLRGLACREEFLSSSSTFKMIIRFGKQLFHGNKTKDLCKNFTPLSRMMDLYGQKHILCQFSLACSDAAITALKAKLEGSLGFVKVSSQDKISVHCIQSFRRFSVSLRFEGEDEKGSNNEVRRILQASNHFQALGVKTEAAEKEIKAAYRKCLVRLRFRNTNWRSTEKAEKVATAAFNTLVDPASRALHLKRIKTPEAFCQKDEDEEPRIPIDGRGKRRIIIRRVRQGVTRHGFVSFTRPGGDQKTDLRLGISSHTVSTDVNTELKEEIDKAWKHGEGGKLDFRGCGKGDLEVLAVRYRRAETYATEDFKLRISWSEEDDMEKEEKSGRWECGLSGRWFKWNDAINEDDASSMLLETDIISFVKQGALISRAMDVGTGTPGWEII